MEGLEAARSCRGNDRKINSKLEYLGFDSSILMHLAV